MKLRPIYKIIKALVCRHYLWIVIAIGVIGVDRVTKMLVVKHLPFHQVVTICPNFNLFFTVNNGAAFSFLNYATSQWQIWLFSAIALMVSSALVVWLVRLPNAKVWQRVALALILGGAMGNLIDRVVYCHVIDFIDLYVKTWHWPAFNIADAAICIGAVLLTMHNHK